MLHTALGLEKGFWQSGTLNPLLRNCHGGGDVMYNMHTAFVVCIQAMFFVCMPAVIFAQQVGCCL